MISTQRKSAEIRRFNKKTIAPTYRFILAYRFFIVSEMQTACQENAPQQAVFT
jgi:hypothetical protein